MGENGIEIQNFVILATALQLFVPVPPKIRGYSDWGPPMNKSWTKIFIRERTAYFSIA